MSKIFGGGGSKPSAVQKAMVDATGSDPVVTNPNLASKAMEAKPVQTVFGGKQEEMSGAILGSKGNAQMAQLAKKYLLGK
jgi:hypothetical protein